MSSFCEYADTKPQKTPKWFAIDETLPLVTFAGIWTEWNGIRGTKANPLGQASPLRVSCEHCFQTRNAAKLNNAWQRRH